MKTKALFFIMLMSIGSFAQIIVDSDDVVSIGDTRYLATDDSPDASIAPGNAGANQTWDFSALNAESIETAEFLDPTGTPYATDFPDATLAFPIDVGYGYLVNSANGLTLLGFGFGGEAIQLNEVWAEWPMEYENTFGWELNIDTIVENTFLPFPGADILRVKKDTANTSEVDAWGSLTIPMGTFEALRVKKTASTIDTIWYKAFPTAYDVETVGTTFSPADITISVLDTVHFTGLGYHNATEVSEVTYLANGTTSNGGFAYGNDASHVFTEAGTYYYVCTPHVGMGMKGIITVVDDWTFFGSNEASTTAYDWWTDDDAIGLPVVSINLDEEGNIEECTFAAENEVVASWNCEEEACVDPADGSGMYGSLEDCESTCTVIASTWDCIADACIDPADGSGEYSSLTDCEANCVSGVNDISVTNPHVFPNPAKENITFDVVENATLTIYALTGELLLEKEISGKHTLALDGFANGIYHYQLRSSSENSTGKFQIIK